MQDNRVDNRVKYLIYGSRHLKGLYKLLCARGEKCEKIINVSPLSSERLLSKKCRECRPEYLIVDLYMCAHFLYSCNGKLKTYKGWKKIASNNDVYDKISTADQSAVEILNPVECYTKEMKKNLKKFFSECKDNFPPEKIILVRSFVPGYFTTDTQLRVLKKNGSLKQLGKFIEKREKIFLSATGATSLNLSQYYFVKKVPGYKLDHEIFEPGYYEDLYNRINEHAGNVSVSSCTQLSSDTVDNTADRSVEKSVYPDFEISLERYFTYQNRTLLWKAFHVFLSIDHLADSIVVSSPAEFVYKNKNSFALLRTFENPSGIKEYDWKTDAARLKKCLEKADFPDDFRKITDAYIDLATGQNRLGSDVQLMFKNRIAGPEVLRSVRKYFSAKGLNPCGIEASNCGYYYAQMNNLNKTEALEYIDSSVTAEPVLVDVFGSCVSNTCVNSRITGNSYIVRNNYYFQIPLYSGEGQKLQYDETIFEDKLDLQDSCVKMQFDNTVRDSVRSSDSSWLVIDAYSFIALKTFVKDGFLFTDTKGVIAKKIGAKKIHIFEESERIGDWQEITDRLKVLCEDFRNKYKNRIIIIDIETSKYHIGDDDVIYNIRENKNIRSRKEILKKVSDYLANELDCYRITFTHDFITDAKGYLSFAMVHYEFDFYDSAAEVINKIVKETPEKKVWNVYPDEVRLKRMLRLMPKNSSALLKKYFRSPLDEIVLQLGAENLKKYSGTIIEWYRNKIMSKEELLSHTELLPEMELRSLVEHADIIPDETGDVPEEYRQYPEWKKYGQRMYEK